MRTVKKYGRVRVLDRGEKPSRCYAWPPGSDRDEPEIYATPGAVARLNDLPLEEILLCLWGQVDAVKGWRIEFAEGRFEQ